LCKPKDILNLFRIGVQAGYLLSTLQKFRDAKKILLMWNRQLWLACWFVVRLFCPRMSLFIRQPRTTNHQANQSGWFHKKYIFCITKVLQYAQEISSL